MMPRWLWKMLKFGDHYGYTPERLEKERRFGTDEKDIDFGSEMHEREYRASTEGENEGLRKYSTFVPVGNDLLPRLSEEWSKPVQIKFVDGELMCREPSTEGESARVDLREDLSWALDCLELCLRRIEAIDGSKPDLADAGLAHARGRLNRANRATEVCGCDDWPGTCPLHNPASTSSEQGEEKPPL